MYAGSVTLTRYGIVLLALVGCVADGEKRRGHDDSTSADSDSGSDSDSGGHDSGCADDSGVPALAGPRGLLVAQSWDHAALPTGAGAGQYRVILLQESMYTLLPEIRAANPDALLLAYQKAGGMRAGDDDHPSTGVTTGEADEAWFLHDEAGDRLEFCDYAGSWAADVGNVDYQARWLENVQERVTRDGFDGVMLDDVNTFPGHCLGSLGTPIAEYPTDEGYGDATVAFMAAVGPGLKAAGLAVAPNIAMNPWEDVMVAQATAMMPSVTHWMREYWMRWDDSENFRGDEWEATLDTMRIAQDAGVAYLGLTYGPGAEGAVEGQRYGRASWLVAWDGVSASAWGYWGDGEDPWGDDWGPDIGLPTGDAEHDGDAWVRRYSGGVAVVNPGDHDGVVVELGDSYVDPELGEVTSVTLDHGRGRVLSRP